ncbi:MAG: phage major capsid protein [Sphingopyxis sp.]|nr:phage major capsid protein [Sphingopyxis sp.]
MLKFFKLINGKKFYCDEKGALIQKDGADVEVAADDTEAVDIESGVDEATKMLAEAMRKAVERGDKVAEIALAKTMEAVERFFEAVGEKAASKTSKVAISTEKASFDVDSVVKGLSDVKGGNRQSVAFEIKNKADLDYLAKSTAKDDLTGDVILPDLQPGMERAPVREVFIEQIADTQETTSDYVSYVEVTGSTGDPATTAELGTIPEKDFTFQEYKKPVQKITVANKHSVEILSDGPELVNAIRGFLAEDVNIVTDTQLLSGNGTAPNLQGVLGVAVNLNTLITASGQILANATHADVLRIGATAIKTAGKGKFRPTHCLLNPTDVEAIDLTKDSEGRYVLPPFISADGTRVSGMTVIENTAITAGTFLMGDFRKLHIRRKGGVEIEITNSDGTDFVKDIITMKVRRRLASYVKTNDNAAFLTGTFATIKTNLAS